MTLYCHSIFLGAEGLGEGWVKIMLIVSCLEWLTCLFLFIMVEFESYFTAPTLKWYSFFLLRKSSKRVHFSNEFMFHSHMKFYVTQWSATRLYGSLSAHSCPLPLEQSPLGSPVKSPLGDSYSNRFTCLKRWKMNEATRLTSWIGGEWNSTANRTHWILPIEANEISEPKRSNENNRKVYVIHCNHFISL